MITQAFTLAADTNVDDLTNVTHPELARYSSIVREMMYAGEFGDYVADLATDYSDDDANATIHIMYFPATERAAISDNGGVNWTDAANVEDAAARYRNDEMMA